MHLSYAILLVRETRGSNESSNEALFPSSVNEGLVLPGMSVPLYVYEYACLEFPMLISAPVITNIRSVTQLYLTFAHICCPRCIVRVMTLVSLNRHPDSLLSRASARCFTQQGCTLEREREHSSDSESKALPAIEAKLIL